MIAMNITITSSNKWVASIRLRFGQARARLCLISKHVQAKRNRRRGRLFRVARCPPGVSPNPPGPPLWRPSIHWPACSDALMR
ncbi:hypothetical protein [Lysobacter gummosus]|uniref:hypothetical protein n=1 Tax=Lysobacter gummosus TaxID=262324 RepID=UPI00364156B7